MRWAVPSSKVGSLESASAAAEREAGVEGIGFAAGFASSCPWAGFEPGPATPIGPAVAGPARGATTEFWQRALSVANSRAMVMMVAVMLRIFQPEIIFRRAATEISNCVCSVSRFETLSTQSYPNDDKQELVPRRYAS